MEALVVLLRGKNEAEAVAGMHQANQDGIPGIWNVGLEEQSQDSSLGLQSCRAVLGGVGMRPRDRRREGPEPASLVVEDALSLQAVEQRVDDLVGAAGCNPLDPILGVGAALGPAECCQGRVKQLVSRWR